MLRRVAVGVPRVGAGAELFDQVLHRVLRASDRQVLEMRQGRDAEGDTDLRVGQGVVDGRDDVIHRALEPLHEGRRDTVRTGADLHTRRLHDEARRALVHLRIDVEQGLAFAVDRDLHQFILAGTPNRKPQAHPHRGRSQNESPHVLELLTGGLPDDGRCRCTFGVFCMRNASCGHDIASGMGAVTDGPSA